MPPLDQIKHHGKQKYSPINDDIPIESRRDDRRRFREKGQHQHQPEIEDSDRVDRAGVSAHVPARRGQVLAAVTLYADAGNRDNVGGEEAGDTKRGDGVEGDCATNVYEGEENGDEEGEEDAVKRDIVAGCDLGGRRVSAKFQGGECGEEI